jgi:ribulose-5-phosphate 4-epimerase/fuculose-1-phosphate aldolase
MPDTPVTPDRSAIKADLVAEVARSATTFWELELTSGLDAGDTSLRDPDTGNVYILPRPNPDQPFANWSEIGDDDVVVVDRGGSVVFTNGLQPTVELQTHLGIYDARPDVHAIVHSHGEWSQIFSVMRWDIPTYTSETYLVAGLGPIRCAPSGGVATPEVARQAVDALGTRSKAALLPSHGAVCVGASFEEAFHVARMVERAARQATFIRLLGGAPQMTLHDLMSPDSYRRMQEAAKVAGETVEDVLARSL